MLYVLNSPILTNYGEYKFKKISLQTAKNQLTKKKFISAVGHEATANLLTNILNIEIPFNRQTIVMKPGDEAIVFKLLQRIPEGKVITTLEELEKIGYEFGHLKMIK